MNIIAKRAFALAAAGVLGLLGGACEDANEGLASATEPGGDVAEAFVPGNSTIEPLTALEQDGVAGELVTPNPTIQLFGPDGEPIADAVIRWDALQGGGEVSSGSERTDEQGRSSVEWRLGPDAGRQVLRAWADRRVHLRFVVHAVEGGGDDGGDPGDDDVASIEISPGGLIELNAIGDVQQLIALVLDTEGSQVEAPVTWSTLNTRVATIDSAGVVRAAGSGTTRAIASVPGGIADTVYVRVEQEVATVTVSPDETTIEVGATVQLSASAVDANGHPVAGATYQWASEQPTIASVASNGLVTGESAGEALITATSDGQEGSVTVTVSGSEPPPPPPPPGSVLFSSDWNTALGNSRNAVSDGDIWENVSADFQNSMEVVRSTGLGFPTQNVFQVTPTVERQGWVLLQINSLPVPAVGESRYYRWYFRLEQPYQSQDTKTHPIQDGGAQSQSNWSFILDDNGDGTYWARYSTRGSGSMWVMPAPLRKHETYRFEVGYTRVSTSAFELHLRVYDAAGNLLYDDDDFRDAYNGNVPLVGNNRIPFNNLSGTRVFNCGNNGIGGISRNFLYAYEGAFCVRSDGWCGEYRDGI